MATSMSAKVSQDDLDVGLTHVRVFVYAGPDEGHRANVGVLTCLKDEALDIADRINGRWQVQGKQRRDPDTGLWPGQQPGVHDHKPYDECPQDCPGRRSPRITDPERPDPGLGQTWV